METRLQNTRGSEQEIENAMSTHTITCELHDIFIDESLTDRSRWAFLPLGHGQREGHRLVKCEFISRLDNASDKSKEAATIPINPTIQIGRHDTCTVCQWRADMPIFRPIVLNKLPTSVLYKSASKNKCSACRILAAVVKQFRSTLIRDILWRVQWISPAGEPYGDGRSGFEFHDQYTANDGSEVMVSLRLDVFIDERDISDAIPARQITAEAGIAVERSTVCDSSSLDSLKWAKRWLNRCCRKHSKCSHVSSARMVSRVLDVGVKSTENPAPMVRLVDKSMSRLDKPYIALSHCWGGVVPDCITTNATLDARSSSVAVDLLPRTFLDAIDVTRALGVRYLWIDSMCIVQDNEQDWRQESAKMHEVYGNALVTLAGVCAKDCHNGLFSQLPAEQHHSRLSSLALGGMQVYTRRHRGWYKAEPDPSEPLLQRAWTFQERLVSRRLLSFTKAGLKWQCLEAFGDEEISDGLVKPRLHDQLSNSSYYSRRQDKQMWSIIVKKYSALQLTKPTDKLLALSAVARQIHQATVPNEYLAGLWNKTLFFDLLWHVQTRNDGIDLHPRTEEYLGPTWSWVSVMSPVENRYLLHGSNKLVQDAEIIQVHCKYVDDIAYGQVKSAALKIRGKLARFVCEVDRDGFLILRHGEHSVVAGTTHESCITTHGCGCVFQIDIQEQNPQEQGLLSILLMGHDKFQITCLLLRKCQGRKSFKRIGLLDCYLESCIRNIFNAQERRRYQVSKQTLESIFSSIDPIEIVIL